MFLILSLSRDFRVDIDVLFLIPFYFIISVLDFFVNRINAFFETLIMMSFST